MSFFVSKSLENIIDEKSYLSKNSEHFSEDIDIQIILNKKILLKKNSFDVINYNDMTFDSIDLKLSKKELLEIFGANIFQIKIISKHSIIETNIKLYKITSIDNNNYYCQFNNLEM